MADDIPLSDGETLTILEGTFFLQLFKRTANGNQIVSIPKVDVPKLRAALEEYEPD